MRQRLCNELMQKLREAIDETLAMSFPVVEALADLEEAGFCPALHVNITVAEQTEGVSREQPGSSGEWLTLSEDDDSFLRTLGIRTPA